LSDKQKWNRDFDEKPPSELCFVHRSGGVLFCGFCLPQKGELTMQIFNTLTRQKEEFVPQVPGEYRIYVCGPTVYNYIHIGNARPLIVFDTLRRYLEYRGNKVFYVSNITDIDDKLIHQEGSGGGHLHEGGRSAL